MAYVDTHEARAEADRIKARAQGTAKEFAGRARSAAEQGKQRLASNVEQVARAIHRTGEELRSADQERLSQVTESVAARVDRLAEHLGRGDVRSLTGEVEDFARRQPALFLGGAFTLGLMAARFLRSSSGRSWDEGGGGEMSNWRDDPIRGEAFGQPVYAETERGGL